MNAFLKMLMMAMLVISFSLQASAKDKKKPLKPWKNQECRYLEARTVETCDGREYARAMVQCGAYAVTGYCRVGKSIDANECLDDDSGDTKDCFKKTRAFSERLKASGKKTRAVVKNPTCAWATDSFLPANDIYVSDLTTMDSISDDCRAQDFVYRRASCQIDGKNLTPMLFCRVADSSTSPINCMKDETDPLVTSCRAALEPELVRERLKRRGGGTGDGTQSTGTVQ